MKALTSLSAPVKCLCSVLSLLLELFFNLAKCPCEPAVEHVIQFAVCVFDFPLSLVLLKGNGHCFSDDIVSGLFNILFCVLSQIFVDFIIAQVGMGKSVFNDVPESVGKDIVSIIISGFNFHGCIVSFDRYLFDFVLEILLVQGTDNLSLFRRLRVNVECFPHVFWKEAAGDAFLIVLLDLFQEFDSLFSDSRFCF